MGIPDSIVGHKAVHLLTDELLHTVTQFYQTLYTLNSRSIKVRLYHAAVFSVVHITVNYGVGVVLHIGVCRYETVKGFTFAKVGQLCFCVSATDILNSIA